MCSKKACYLFFLFSFLKGWDFKKGEIRGVHRTGGPWGAKDGQECQVFTSVQAYLTAHIFGNCLLRVIMVYIRIQACL